MVSDSVTCKTPVSRSQLPGGEFGPTFAHPPQPVANSTGFHPWFIAAATFRQLTTLDSYTVIVRTTTARTVPSNLCATSNGTAITN
jgi:hypothetical protein